MRISDWSSDVCSSDLLIGEAARLGGLFSGRSGGVRLGLAQGHPTSLSVRVERSRDTPRDGARLMGVSPSLDTNGHTKVTPPAGVPLRTPVLALSCRRPIASMRVHDDHLLLPLQDWRRPTEF